MSPAAAPSTALSLSLRASPQLLNFPNTPNFSEHPRRPHPSTGRRLLISEVQWPGGGAWSWGGRTIFDIRRRVGARFVSQARVSLAFAASRCGVVLTFDSFVLLHRPLCLGSALSFLCDSGFGLVHQLLCLRAKYIPSLALSMRAASCEVVEKHRINSRHI